MRVLKKLLAIVALGGALGACYVETHPHPYYAYRTCRPGYGWDGYHCRYHYY
jgi:hypothetical protein